MTKTILVVEDDKLIQGMLQDALENEGFEVRSERDGLSGLRSFLEKPADLLIIDLLIPRMKGIDLIARVREDEKGKTIPIIVISGVYRSVMHQDRINEKHRIVAYLDKPIDLGRLSEVLHDVFSGDGQKAQQRQSNLRGALLAETDRTVGAPADPPETLWPRHASAVPSLGARRMVRGHPP